jgi:hypothetical protein
VYRVSTIFLPLFSNISACVIISVFELGPKFEGPKSSDIVRSYAVIRNHSIEPCASTSLPKRECSWYKSELAEIVYHRALPKEHLTRTRSLSSDDVRTPPKTDFIKQLIRPMMDYACPIWRSAASSHVRNLQVLQSNCLHIANNAPWYFGNRQIYEDLWIPFFAGHIRASTEGFDSKLADAVNPLVRQLRRHLCRPWAD